jgi:hypothetical protein
MTIPILVLAVYAGFLFLLGGLGLAATKAIDPRGENVRRGPGGTLAALVVTAFIAGLGLVGCAVFLGTTLVATAVEHQPVERIEILRGERPEVSDAVERSSKSFRLGEEPVVVRFTVKGELGTELVDLMHELFDGEVGVYTDRDPVRDVTVYEFVVPVDERDVQELERELEKELDWRRDRGLLPDGIVIELRTR